MKNYLIKTEFYNILNEEIKGLTSIDCQKIFFDLEVDQVEDVIEEINSISLFNDKKIIICKNLDLSLSYKETLEEFLNYYLNNLNPNVSLIFSTSKNIDQRLNISKLFNNHFTIIDLIEKDMFFYINRIKELLKSDGYQINDSNLRLLWEKTSHNYDICLNELDKLMIIADKDKIITIDDIEKNVPLYTFDELFTIKDYIIKNKKDEYIKLLENYKLFKKSMMPLISVLANDFRLMYLVKNTDYSDKELSDLLKIHAYPIKLARGNSYNYSSNSLVNYLLNLANLDLKIKSGLIDEYIGFDLFLLEMGEK